MVDVKCGDQFAQLYLVYILSSTVQSVSQIFILAESGLFLYYITWKGHSMTGRLTHINYEALRDIWLPSTSHMISNIRNSWQYWNFLDQLQYGVCSRWVKDLGRFSQLHLVCHFSSSVQGASRISFLKENRQWAVKFLTNCVFKVFLYLLAFPRQRVANLKECTSPSYIWGRRPSLGYARREWAPIRRVGEAETVLTREAC